MFDIESNSNTQQKESVSLFGISLFRLLNKQGLNSFFGTGLLDKTRSVLGKQMLRQWVAHPLQDQKTISDRHMTIRFFSRQVPREKLSEIASLLKHIKNIHRLLSKIKQSKATYSDWQYILKVNQTIIKSKNSYVYTFGFSLPISRSKSYTICSA